MNGLALTQAVSPISQPAESALDELIRGFFRFGGDAPMPTSQEHNDQQSYCHQLADGSGLVLLPAFCQTSIRWKRITGPLQTSLTGRYENDIET